ncbi:hypothetical protein BRC97_03960 [Halobacteriales archaeon QS_6_71_20]|nr:MAG: hypothetical protein BRC97_03960 [Halobacteriales archaeon QS_6_71_20]
MTDSSPEPLTVLLVVAERSDRRLLREFLADADRFEPRVADPDAPFDAAFDVCLLDVAATRDHGDALAGRRRRAETYRPTLLFVPERYGAPERALSEPGTAEELVDETIAAPVRRAELARRLRSLGRARRYSTELAASRNRFRGLVEQLPDALFVCEGGVVTYANPTARSLLECADGAVDGTPLARLHVPADRDRVADLLDRAAAQGRAGPTEVGLAPAAVEAPERADAPADDSGGSARTDDGAAAAGDPATADRSTDADGVDAGERERERTQEPAVIPVELTAVGVGDDEVQVVGRDLRGRREREERLALYRRAMDEATVGITIADHSEDDEPLVYVNEEFRRLTGRTEEELLGENPRVLQTDATDPETVARLRAAIDAGEEASAVLLNSRPNGRSWYNELDISPIRDEHGDVSHYLGFQRDVTERVSRNQRLTVLDRVLRHNIRNRLNVVLGYADRIEGAIDAPGESAATDDPDAAELVAEVDRIREAATDVLDLSDSARRFREEVVDGDEADPVDAVAVAVEAASKVADAHPDAEIRFVSPDAPLRVAGAPPLMLVIEELVTNAVDHVADPTVTVSLSGDDGVVLRVADDGPGISADDRAALGHGSETPTEHGQGIGLWLVRWTVDAAGGTVDYDEGADGGAVVVARFPAAAEPEADGEPSEGESPTDDSRDGTPSGG